MVFSSFTLHTMSGGRGEPAAEEEEEEKEE